MHGLVSHMRQLVCIPPTPNMIYMHLRSLTQPWSLQQKKK